MLNKVRLIGLPTDSHSSFLRGPAQAPAAIRGALASEHGNMATELGAEVGLDIELEDAGDLSLDESAGDFDRISGAASAAAQGPATPIFLGGDHMVTFPVIAGMAEVHGPLNILHFDAHPDLYNDFAGDPLSHASPFARIMERGLAKRLVQVGIRTLNGHCREQAERFGVEIVEMRSSSATLLNASHSGESCATRASPFGVRLSSRRRASWVDVVEAMIPAASSELLAWLIETCVMRSARAMSPIDIGPFSTS